MWEFDYEDNHDFEILLKNLNDKFPFYFDKFLSDHTFDQKNIEEYLSYTTIFKTLVSIDIEEAKKLTETDINQIIAFSEKLVLFPACPYQSEYTINIDFFNEMHSFIDLLEILKPCTISRCARKKTKKELRYDNAQRKTNHKYIGNEESPYSKEELNRFDKCNSMFKNVNNSIDKKRAETTIVLLNNANTASDKKNQLNEYMEYRMFPDKYIIDIGDGNIYSGKDLYELADKLFSETDEDCFLERREFFENSIDFADEIIAYHNFRLTHDETSLFFMIKLLTIFINNSLGFNDNYFEDDMSNKHFNHSESISHLKSLVTYISNYWDKFKPYYKEKKSFNLKDDYSLPISDKIDYDAGIYIGQKERTTPLKLYLDFWRIIESAEQTSKGKENANQKIQSIQNTINETIIEFNSVPAAENISNCTKSIYLLLNAVKEINSPELKDEKRKLVKIYDEICRFLYRDEHDTKEILTEDERLNKYILNDAENKAENSILKNENELLKSVIQVHIDELNGASSEYILTQWKAIRESCYGKGIPDDTILLIEQYHQTYLSILEKSVDQKSLDKYKKDIQKEIGTQKADLMPIHALNSLATAELLYNLFVLGKHPDDFDFSGISALYFQAFEATYDWLIIRRCSDWLSKANVADLFYKYIKSNFKNKECESEVKKYYDIKNATKIYDANNKIFKKGMTIGEFYYLINWLINNYDKTSEIECSEFKKFIFSPKGFGRTVEKKDLCRFLNNLYNAKKHRNSASHGPTPINIATIKEDKTIVYDEKNLSKIKEYKNILYDFLKFFDENNLIDL